MSADTAPVHRGPIPALQIPSDADPLLTEAARAASAAAADAWATRSRSELAEEVRIGADGTASMCIDLLVEEAIDEVCARAGVNLLSEEAGLIDRGSARTLVTDPLDGSANAASGVGLSCFAGVLVEDTTCTEALTCWIETGRVLHTRRDETAAPRTSGRRSLDGAALSLLRPKQGRWGDTMETWTALVRRAARVRILSTSCLEAMLVAEGATDVFADPGSDTHRLVDLLAATVHLPAAGGAVIDAFGRPIELDADLSRRWSGVVAATEELAEQTAEVICEHLPQAVDR